MRRIIQPPEAAHFEGDHPPAGDATFILGIGGIVLRFRGLPVALRDQLEQRYSKFLAPGFDDGLDVEVCDAGRDYYIDPPEVSEFNPVHLVCDGERVRFVGYRLAGVFDTAGRTGRVMLARGEHEPADRAMENYIRAAVAWQAAERGGALVHGASAVLDDTFRTGATGLPVGVPSPVENKSAVAPLPTFAVVDSTSPPGVQSRFKPAFVAGSG